MKSSSTHLLHQFAELKEKNRLPQSILLLSPTSSDMNEFRERFYLTLLCENHKTPCGNCSTCHLLSRGGHPDVHEIRPESTEGAIKVDVIRELQTILYRTPQMGRHQLVSIMSADRLNINAANALLKILEEPPSSTIFLLMAQQLGSIPATILSRCQKYILPSALLTEDQGYLNELPLAESILVTLEGLYEGRASPVTVALQWSSQVFIDLLRALYLVTAEIIRCQWVPKAHLDLPLARKFPPIQLFKQLELIHGIIRKLNHNIQMNQTLVLEDLLVGYLKQGG